jgi:hypothetical protein
VAWVRERTIPTEQPPLFGEVSANFCEQTVPRGNCDNHTTVFSIFWPELLPFLPSSSTTPLLHRKSGSAGNRMRTSGSVARNSDHYTAVAVNMKITNNFWLTTASVDCQYHTVLLRLSGIFTDESFLRTCGEMRYSLYATNPSTVLFKVHMKTPYEAIWGLLFPIFFWFLHLHLTFPSSLFSSM